MQSGCAKKDTPKLTRHEYISKMNGVHIWHGTDSYSSKIHSITDTFGIVVISDTSIELYLTKKISGIPERVTCQLVTPKQYDPVYVFEKIRSIYLSYTITYDYGENSIHFRMVETNFHSGRIIELSTP